MDVSKNIDRPSLLREGLPIVRDLMRPEPLIYWADYVSCTLLGWVAFILSCDPETATWVRTICFTLAGLCLYRSVIFVHEIVHLKKGAIPFFMPIWNLLTGVPWLIPSFFYEGVHLTHHKRNVYGTSDDGEYLPFVRKGRLFIVMFFLSNLLLPPVLFFRHLVLAPLSLFSRRLRHWVWARLSSLEIDPSYVRPLPSSGGIPVGSQALASGFCAGVGLAFYSGKLPSRWLIMWYGMAAFILAINAIRTLVAHRYCHSADEMIDVTQQYLDSIDIPGNFFTALWAPVGLRFHATHHLYPGVPYHNLRLAHQRLNAGLIENGALYRRAMRPSLWKAITELWIAAGH